MKKIVFALGLAIASLAPVQAQTTPTAPGGQLRWVFGLGITVGGDNLATAKYVDGGKIDIDAGGGVMISGGVDYIVNSSFSFQGTIGGHGDNASAKNGDVRFERFPIEVAAYYHPMKEMRIGAGVRYVSSPKLKRSGAAGNRDEAFKNTVSPMIEAEWLYSSNIGIKARYVKEEFESKVFGDKVNADHFGIFANFYF